MAEQAVNTIYLLGEQPDALCGDIIKDFARRVFASKGPTPSTSAADVEPLKSGSVAGSAPPSPSRERSASEEIRRRDHRDLLHPPHLRPLRLRLLRLHLHRLQPQPLQQEQQAPPQHWHLASA